MKCKLCSRENSVDILGKLLYYLKLKFFTLFNSNNNFVEAHEL